MVYLADESAKEMNGLSIWFSLPVRAFLAPGVEGGNDGAQGLALRRQGVLDHSYSTGNHASPQDPVGLHLPELLRQYFGADAQGAAQPAKVARAVADFAEDQQFPAAGQHLDGVHRGTVNRLRGHV